MVDEDKERDALGTLSAMAEELDDLRIEVKRLRAENADLKASDAGRLLAGIRRAVHQLGSAPAAIESLRALAKDPGSAT